MTISTSAGPGVKSVTIIRTDPLPDAGAAVAQAARQARFVVAISLLLLRRETPDVHFFDVTTQQTHTFEFDTTENPVQDGSTITDHTRRLPEELTIDGLIVDTPLGLPAVPIQANRASRNFQKLLSFARAREPVLVATSLQIYESMIIRSITVPRDVDSGSSIPCSVRFREIKIASTLVELAPVAEEAGELGAIPPTNVGVQSPVG